MLNVSIVAAALKGTPTWVWAVLAYLLFVGLRATKPRVVFVPYLFLVPAILLGMKVPALARAPLSDAVIFLTTLVFGLAAGWLCFARAKVVVDRTAKSVSLPGSWSTLLIVLAVFAVHYVFGYLEATRPTLACDFHILKLALQGIIAGILWGRSMRYVSPFFY